MSGPRPEGCVQAQSRGVSRSRPRGSRPRPKRGVQAQAAGCVQAQAQGVQVYLTSRTVLLLPFESANGGFMKYKVGIIGIFMLLKIENKGEIDQWHPFEFSIPTKNQICIRTYFVGHCLQLFHNISN